MRLKSILTLIFFVLFCFKALSISTPPTSSLQQGFEDTTLTKRVHAPVVHTQDGRVSFFGKLKGKLLTLFSKHQPSVNRKASTKSILGWVALGAIVVGLALLALTSGGAAAGFFLLGGLVAGIVALCLPKSKADKEAKKKSNSAAIVAIGLVVGLVIVLAIALSPLGIE